MQHLWKITAIHSDQINSWQMLKYMSSMNSVNLWFLSTALAINEQLLQFLDSRTIKSRMHIPATMWQKTLLQLLFNQTMFWDNTPG